MTENIKEVARFIEDEYYRLIGEYRREAENEVSICLVEPYRTLAVEQLVNMKLVDMALRN